MREQSPNPPAIASMPPAELRRQAASAVFMVRPASFAYNEQTQASNRFQRAEVALDDTAAKRARGEFDLFARLLGDAGVMVYAFDDRADPRRPDAVFPNNWVSFHHDGTVVLYPMLAPNRRLERRTELLAALVVAGGYRVRRLLDLTHHETRQAFLEGTGSVVFDHLARVAYAGLSPRTHRAPLMELCDELGYAPCVFTTADAGGVPVYHTNVLLSVGTRSAVVAGDLIDPVDRARVLARLAASGRDIVSIDGSSTRQFAGNVLELRARDGAAVLALSSLAIDAFAPLDLARLRKSVDRVVTARIPTIERLGGGSVRCMLAEVFLQR